MLRGAAARLSGSKLLGQAESVIKLIEDKDTPYPLKPVLGSWPDLPSGARPSPERLKTMEEERAIYAIREPLTRFLLDTKRNVNDSGTPDQKQRFQENGLAASAELSGVGSRLHEWLPDEIGTTAASLQRY